ncbi:hypothetical protein V6R21_21010 [Limibacter armeniacum]|uniref:hypothetical protein n=1 Tax=Limibacter armeniacum TaxID=466084 RepID=UPI002FE605FB
MFWIYHSILIIYLLLSSTAIIIRVYRSFLQYMPPIRGYVISGALITALLLVDVMVYNLGSDKISQYAGQQKSNTTIQTQGAYSLR